jgi:hypothetical protein
MGNNMKWFYLIILMPLVSALTTTTVPLNTWPTVAVISMLILILLIFTMFMNVKILGVLAGLFIILLGLFITTSGIYYETGYVVVGATTQIVVSDNSTTSTYQNINNTKVFDYQKVQFPPIISNGAPMDAGQFLGLILLCCGIYACLHYGGRMYGSWK